ncbi:hypothetical protein EHW97_08615 [Aeromicrobium camelliae]|uniref:DNA-binding protein n=1 Tax=Aeromicrobium camelliae TaxID=1538144 RepID=A0A3N6ZC93_9ACTN|nr:helix-hairpin-helix domain-containing protein [Aeromicrobium camelliae]RQN07811.1 hypothetical protein EHW97_08615 [Aeromicrobium camelliae]
MEHPADATEFPNAIGRPAAAALRAHDITTYAQLAELSSDALLEMHGVGPKAVRVLSEELSARGLAFADGADPGRRR